MVWMQYYGPLSKARKAATEKPKQEFSDAAPPSTPKPQPVAQEGALDQTTAESGANREIVEEIKKRRGLK